MHMKVFIVHAHPEPKSFNGALTRAAQQHLKENNHEVIISDLYRMDWKAASDWSNFNTRKHPDYLKQMREEAFAYAHDGFASDIKAELEKLYWCDVLIFQFPMWWFSMPAILKGWVDRVFAMGATYDDDHWLDRGKLAGRRAMISFTTGGSPAMFSPNGILKDINHYLLGIQYGILRYVGFDVLPPFIAWQAAQLDDDGRKQYLADYRNRLSTLMTTEPLFFTSIDDYDPIDFTLKPQANLS
jgi:NAD(P)H dehydrogenase (quinone)